MTEKGFFDERLAKQKWESDSALRTEFNGDLECYLAYAKAETEGRVKIMGKRNK